jgi:phosphate-selective porin OprO and OprP
MKRVVIFVGIFAWVFCAMNAGAKTLEDVLREKGVITEEDYKEVTKVKPFDYKLGKGFTFTTPDEKFQLTLGGRMQFRYTFTDFDNNTSKSDTSQWDAKRIRLIAQGYAYTKDLTYTLEFDPRAYATASNKGLINAWLNYKLLDEAQLMVGQFKSPWARQELISDGNLQFVDRSIAVDAFKPSYDIGAMLNGKIANGLAYYYAGLFNGVGQTSTRNSNDNMFAARAVVNPLGDFSNYEADLDMNPKPLLSIGANYFRNTVNKTAAATATSTGLDVTNANYAASGGWLYRDTVNNASFAAVGDKLDIDSYGADLAFKWMGISLQGEYLLAQAENQRSGGLLRAQGFYAQAGYMVLPKTLEIAFRYSYLDPNRDASNDHLTEQIGAVSYYFSKHSLKIQADAGNIHTQTSTKPTDDMQYRVQAQIVF